MPVPKECPRQHIAPNSFTGQSEATALHRKNKPVYELVFSERMKADPVPAIGDKYLTMLENARKS